MNKYLAILYSTTLLVACHTNEDPIIPSPEPGDGLVAISFAPQLTSEEEATRADTYTDLGQGFNVTGYKFFSQDISQYKDSSLQTVFDTVQVRYEDETGYDYRSDDQPERYWDTTAVCYRFWAYIPSEKTAFHRGDDADTVIYTVSDIESIESSEPVYSKPVVRERGDEGIDKNTVRLIFKRALCEVRVVFLSSTGIPINLNGAKFYPTGGSIYTDATIRVVYSKNSGPDDSESFKCDCSGDQGSIRCDGEFHPQIPCGPQSEYKLDVTLSGNRERSLTVSEEYMTWENNYKYTYRFRLSPDDDIIFSDVKIEDMEFGGDYDQTIQKW